MPCSIYKILRDGELGAWIMITFLIGIWSGTTILQKAASKTSSGSREVTSNSQREAVRAILKRIHAPGQEDRFCFRVHGYVVPGEEVGYIA